MNSRSFAALAAVAFFAFVASLALAQNATPEMKVAKEFKIGGDGRWDYVIIDPRTKRLYVPRSDRVQVINAEDGTLIGEIKGTAGVHGVALAPEFERGFSSNGTDASVTVFDLKTLAVLGKVKTGEKPDAIIYDPASKKVFAFDGKSEDFTAFDANADVSKEPATQRVALGGAPEYAVTDGQGNVYVNLEDKSEIVRIDSKEMKVTAHWKLEGGDGPSGLAMDAAHRRLFSVCHNKVMVVVDADSGKTITTVPIGSGVDAAGFDADRGLAFSSNGDGTLTVVKEESPDKFTVAQNVKTQQGARTMTLDPTTHKVYLPTADFGGEKDQRGRAKMTPGTFRILVVE